MQKTAQVYPANLAGIERIGSEYWHKTFSLPFHSEEYQLIYEAFQNAYTAALPPEDLKDPLYQICVACYKINMSLADYFFDSMMYIECGKQGYTHLAMEKDILVPDAVKQQRNSIRFLVPEYKGFFFRFRENWRKIRVNWGHHNIIDSLVPGDLSRHTTYLVGDRDCAEVTNYIKKTHINPLSLRPSLYLIERFRTVQDQLLDDIREFCSSFFSNFKNFYGDTENLLDDFVQKKTLDYLLNSVRNYNSFNQYLARRDIEGKGLLVNPIGNLLLRLFAAAWRSNGGKVTAFSHGNSYVECYPTDILNGSHLIADTYVASSTGDKIVQEHEIAKNKGPFVSNAKIIAVSSSYHSLFEKLQSVPYTSEKIKKILISGYPMDYMHYFGWTTFNTLTMLHFEISVIKTLKRAGYYVIYKAHPESSSETAKIIPDFSDEFLTEDFSTTYKKADCLLYTYPGTTTFGFSLMTNIPIVVFCENIDKWHPELLKLLKKRCRILSISLNKKSHVEFDTDALIDAVNSAPASINHEIIKEFALK